jgi:hypothetical protein
VNKIWILTSFFSCVLFSAFAQSSLTSTEEKVNNERKELFLKSIYNKDLPNSRDFINGEQFNYQYPHAKNYPFFDNNNWQNGKVIYHKEKIEVLLKYDIFLDNLLIQHLTESGAYILKLNPEIVNSFYFSNHYFKYYTKLYSKKKPITPGFFEVMYEGNISFLIKHLKYLSRETETSPAEYIQEKHRYFVLDNQLFEISNRRSLLSLFADKRKEMKSYLSESKISVRFATDEDLIQIIKQYNSLKASN